MIVVTALIVKFCNFGELNKIVTEVTMLTFLLILFLCRKWIVKSILSNTKKQSFGIQENLDLFFVAVKFTCTVFILTIIAFFIEHHFRGDVSYQLFAREQLILFSLLWIYTTAKFRFLKNYLSNAEYFPILNESGNVMGYESKEHLYLESKDENQPKKNIHPVIRILLILDDKLFLKKYDSSDLAYPDKWDASISEHLLFGETYEDGISRLLKKNYNIKENLTHYLLKYSYENNYEHQQVYLNYMHVNDSIMQNADLSNIKPWSITQILDELDSNIFTDKLKKEIILLKELSFPSLFGVGK